MQTNYMSHVARKRFFEVNAPNLPACVHVHDEDTEINTSLFLLRIFGDFSIIAGRFSLSVAKKHRL